MTLPARREADWFETPRARPRPRIVKEPQREAGMRSPANELLAQLEKAHLPRGYGLPRRRKNLFGGLLLGWSFALAAASIGYVAFETLKAPELRPAPPAPLALGDIVSRHVQSSEGAALEITGTLRNIGDRRMEPEVLLQLAGSRVAIEEPLRLGGNDLLPGAERPFTVRLLLPEGTRSVKLLPPRDVDPGRSLTMPTVSPGWTAELH
jgi:hypothetical protein